MNPLWHEIPIHVLDFEGSSRTGVIEYGMVTLHHGAIVATQTRLCAPLASVPHAETRCHGLRDADLAGAAPFSTNWTFFSEARRSGVLCAHHAPTEHTLLKTVWPYPGAMPDPAHPGEFCNDWAPWIDTHRLALAWRPGLPDYKLDTLTRHFALAAALADATTRHCPTSRRKPHCALHDALAAALLLCRLCGENIPSFAPTAAAPPDDLSPSGQTAGVPRPACLSAISLETLLLASLPPPRRAQRLQNTFDSF